MGKCKDCYFYGQCCSEDKCEDFTPIDDDMSEEELDELRKEYHEVWFEYISENE